MNQSNDPLLAGLNPQQSAAVTHAGGPLLVVAGAGSGKTRVLTRRIAYLMSRRNVAPYQILAITFTNKAAGEMKERVADLVGPVAKSMWVSTFHSACVRLLRQEANRLGYSNSFSIYDSADSLRLITIVAKELNLDSKEMRTWLQLNFYPPNLIHLFKLPSLAASQHNIVLATTSLLAFTMTTKI